MEKLKLGKTELMVTKLGFGSIPIQRLGEDNAVAIIERCLDLGINFIDTANAYSTSEHRIGKAIKNYPRENLIIATKSHMRKADSVAEHINRSLRELGTDYLDLFQFHNVSDHEDLGIIMGSGGAMGALKEAQHAGIVRHIGVSSHSLDVAIELVKTDLFETIMFPFNFITCEPAERLLPLTRQYDMGFIAMKPLAGGMIEDVRLSFKYLFQFPDVIPIPGIQEIREIEEIVNILHGSSSDYQLTPQDCAEIDRVREELGTRFCRRCDYCQPCSADIPINVVMTFPGSTKRMPAQMIYSGGFMTDAMEKATQCTQCGDCEGRCPYGLPIRDMLQEHLEWYQREKEKFQKA